MAKKREGHKSDVTINGKRLKGCFDYVCHIKRFNIERYDGRVREDPSGDVTLSCFTHGYSEGDRLALDAIVDLVLTDFLGQSLSYKAKVVAATHYENVAEVPRIVYELEILMPDGEGNAP